MKKYEDMLKQKIAVREELDRFRERQRIASACLLYTSDAADIYSV